MSFLYAVCFLSVAIPGLFVLGLIWGEDEKTNKRIKTRMRGGVTR